MSQDNARGFNTTIPVSGDLSGLLERAKVVGFEGIPVSITSPATNQTIAYNGSSWTNTYINMGGDVTGTNTSSTVIKLQNVAVASTTPTNTQVLKYVSGSSQWQPATISTPTVVGVIVITGSHTVSGTDTAIVVTGSNPTGSLYFPATAPVGRVLMVGYAGTGTSAMYLTPGAGSNVDGSNVARLINKASGAGNGAWVCFDGVNWAPIII